MSSTRKKQKRRQTFLLIVLSVSLIVVAIISTFAGYKLLRPQKVAFFSRDIDSAADSCEESISSYFGERMVSKRYDELSSRYNAQRRLYLIYYRVYSKEVEDDVPEVIEYLAKCTVWETLGYVSDFEVYKI